MLKTLAKNSQYKLIFHIHIISTQISKLAEARLVDLGYAKISFLVFERNDFIPLHYSFKTDSYFDIMRLWISALEIIESDKSFIGHISRETISNKFIKRYSEKESENFVLSKPFPLNFLNTIEILHCPYKKADLHVKRNISTEINYIDLTLIEIGFSEVWTNKSRLYTIQIESVRDAKKIFNLLKQYFDEAGGINQLSFEIVNEVIKFPTNLKMTKVLPAGSII
jgi:hypothetical protein